MALDRLDKILSHQGFGSRKDVKRLCHSGVVFINGKIVTDPGIKIDISKDKVFIEGKELTLLDDVYIMMNKCQNVVSANKDGEHETVFDLIDDSLKHKFSGGYLHCVGRLDIDTEGLLLLTTDGELTHKLLSPKTHIPKTYAVGLKNKLSDEEKNEYISKFSKGFFVSSEGKESGFDCQPSKLTFLNDEKPDFVEKNSSGKADCLLTIYEGKFHQVKRMFLECQNEVQYLKRVKMGELSLDPSIKLGEYRLLTEEEISILKSN